MVSVIIPARNEIYLKHTIDNVLANAEGEIEVIVLLDGYIPDPKLVYDSRVKFVYHEKALGQRQSINEGAKIARGEFVMKLDAHCAVDKGFDVKLAADCEKDWTVIPRMYNLDVETWKPKLIEDWPKAVRHGKVHDYIMMGQDGDDKLRTLYYPHYENKQLHRGRENILIDDTMSCMGPCFFMRKDRFWELGGCDEEHGSWGQQGIEVACKAWLSGGSLKVNKKTWFAHWFRGGGGPGWPYDIDNKQVYHAKRYSEDLWLNDKWPLAKRKFSWLLEKFNPPGWMGAKKDMTILYYTSNKENEVFENNIISELLKNSSGVPIVSVSQKPINLGKNICVGDVGRSNLNILRQIQIGAREAKTKNVCMAESDVLYPKEYFSLVPQKEDTLYFIGPLYILWENHASRYYLKKQSEGAVVSNREHLLRVLDKMLDGMPQWSDINHKVIGQLDNFSKKDFISIKNPIVTIKTSNNFHKKSPHSIHNFTREIPLWGSSKELFERLNSK